MYDVQLNDLNDRAINLEKQKQEKIKSKENTHMELQKNRDLIEENFKKEKKR